MDPKNREQEGEQDFNVDFENETFSPNFEEENDDDDDWFDNILEKENSIEDDQQEFEEEQNENKEEEEDSDLNFNEDENQEGDEEEESDDDFDLKSFNEKMNKNFKSQKELKDFLKSKDEKEEVNNDEEIIRTSNQAIEYYTPLLQKNDKELMHAQYEAIAVSENKDINNPEVQEEIEDKVQSLIDSYELSVQASNLRDKLKDLVSDAKGKKQEIERKKTDLEKAKDQKRKESLQNKFADIYSNKEFFGVHADKKNIEEVYKKVSSGDFIKELQNDPAKLAEVAMLYNMKEKIHKKASGKTYSDGLKEALDVYDKTKEDKAISRARKNGSNSGSGSSNSKLVSDFIS